MQKPCFCKEPVGQVSTKPGLHCQFSRDDRFVSEKLPAGICAAFPHDLLCFISSICCLSGEILMNAHVKNTLKVISF